MVSEDDVLKIADLARLIVAPEEKKPLTDKLNSILGMVEELKKVDLSGVEPMSHVHGSSNIFREDQKVDSDIHEQAFQNVPDSSGRFIKVPIIIEQA